MQINGKYLNELVPDTALDEGCCRVSYRMDMMEYLLSNIRFPLHMMFCRRRVNDAEDVVEYMSTPTHADDNQVNENEEFDAVGGGVEFDVGGGGGFGSDAEDDFQDYEFDDNGDPVLRRERINEDEEIAAALEAGVNEGESSAAGKYDLHVP